QGQAAQIGLVLRKTEALERAANQEQEKNKGDGVENQVDPAGRKSDFVAQRHKVLAAALRSLTRSRDVVLQIGRFIKSILIAEIPSRLMHLMKRIAIERQDDGAATDDKGAVACGIDARQATKYQPDDSS